MLSEIVKSGELSSDIIARYTAGQTYCTPSTINLASPMLAAFALLVLGGYPGLYVMSASLAVIGGISVMMVRGSR